MALHRRIWNVFRSERVSQDIDREMTFHISELADDLVAGGMGEEAARSEAKRRFGNDLAQKERTRDADLTTWLETFFADIAYALRSVRANPGFSLVVVLSLGLGIGANTAIFTLINAVMLKTLPVRNPQELVQVTIGEDGTIFPNPVWEQLRDRESAFSGIFAYGTQPFDLASGGEARPVNGAWVSGAFFTTLGVRPAAGRLLSAQDDWRGCPPIAVLSHGVWEMRYGGAPSAVGSAISLDGHAFEIVGVAQKTFSGMDVGRTVDVYVPLCAEAVIRGDGSALDRASNWFLTVMGRPLPEAGEARARAQLAALSPAVFAASVPTHYSAEGQERFRANVLGAKPASHGASSLRVEYSSALIALMAIVGVVLVIACANVANLLLARATVRQREIAVRLAIGAGRGRIVRQLLTESMVLAFLGAAFGVVFAKWGSQLLVGFISNGGDDVWLDLSVDVRILGFTILIATMTGLLFGLAPAWRAMRVAPQTVLKASTRSVAGRSPFNPGKALVVSQIALSMVLLMSAGLLLRTFWALSTMDPGFQKNGVLVAEVILSNTRYTPEMYGSAFNDMLARVRRLPGVQSASASQITPISKSTWNDIITVEGYTPPADEGSLVMVNQVSDGYFATLRTPVIAGRDFSREDTRASPKVTIITESLAEKYFGGVGAIGKQLRFQVDNKPGPPVTVIAVVKDAKYAALREEIQPTAYVAVSQEEKPGPYLNFTVLAAAGAASVIEPLRQLAADMDPAITLRFKTLDAQLDESIARERLLATLSAFFGALALILAMIGLYGIMAYNVAQRRNEIGIRIALGSARSRVLSMVLGEVGRLVTAGIALGVLVAWASMRLMRTFVFGVDATDPGMYVMTGLLLACVAVAAGAVPAWKAARLDPMTALREE